MDVFVSQMTTAVLDAFKKANICFVNARTNMTKFYETLSLMVNGYCKRFLKRKFNEWYWGQVKAQLDNDVDIDNDVLMPWNSVQAKCHRSIPSKI